MNKSGIKVTFPILQILSRVWRRAKHDLCVSINPNGEKLFANALPNVELPRWLSGKESTCQCKRHRLIPALGRSSGEGNNPLQYSCLVNSMDREAWWGYSPWGRKRVGHNSPTKQQSLSVSAFVETENRF